MKRDVKILIAGLVLVSVGIVAFAGLALNPVSPDLGPTFASRASHWAAGAALLCVLIGSMMIGGAAVSFCYWIAPKALARTGAIFLLAAGAVSVASHALVVTTYAYVPVILPWMVSVFSGAVLLLVAVFRAIVSGRRS
jgi:hypothetical protein